MNAYRIVRDLDDLGQDNFAYDIQSSTVEGSTFALQYERFWLAQPWLNFFCNLANVGAKCEGWTCLLLKWSYAAIRTSPHISYCTESGHELAPSLAPGQWIQRSLSNRPSADSSAWGRLDSPRPLLNWRSHEQDVFWEDWLVKKWLWNDRDPSEVSKAVLVVEVS